MPQKINAASIQKHIEIGEIKDNVIILKNKGLRAILMATSINFALKSTEEQNAIIFRYQAFLNSIDFPLQIVASLRKFDIIPYIQTLKQKQEQQENDLLKIQTSEYIDFIKGLTEMTNIMTESFYVVIPYNPITGKKKKFFDQIIGIEKQKSTKEDIFQELKINLWQRVEFIAIGLRSMGIKTVPLNTEELIELFYRTYNPSAKEDLVLGKDKDIKNQ